jgi:chromate transporter
LREVAGAFLRLGVTAFGGPAAYVALMEDEFVGRRRWVSRARFLDLLGATNLIPGPNATELACHLGLVRAGWRGLVAAGVGFTLPSAVAVGVLAWAYVEFGSRPEAVGLMAGVQPVVIAVVAQALVRLGRTAIRSGRLAALAVVALGAAALGVHELVVLFGVGGLWLAAAFVGRRPRRPGGAAPLALAFPCVLGVPALALQATAFSVATLAWVFLKVGAVLFGSGYVLLAFLRADLVDRLGWLSEAQLLDAIAVGQVTPGPVLTAATFIGYLLGGPFAAAVATVAIFLPGFVFVALSAPAISRLRASAVAGAFLDAVNVASLALMLVVTWRLGAHALTSLPSVLLALAALGLLRLRVNSAWLVLGGAALGLALGV